MEPATPLDARSGVEATRSRRSFAAVCETCLKDVPADLVVEGGSAYHEKHCPEHGDRRWLVSENGERYARFDRGYHAMFPGDAQPPPPLDAYFAITNRCNQACDYCGTEANRYDGYFGDYELDRFRELTLSSPSRTIGLIGGEPLMHPRFFDFVETIGASGRKTQLFTNGLGLSDEDTVRRFQSASRGNCIVRMSFEGFTEDEYEHLGIPRARERKLQTLQNLARLGIPVTLSHTITAAEQDDPARLRRVMRSLIEHAMRDRTIGALNFQALSALGASRDRASSESMSVDRVMDRIVDALPVPVERSHVYVTQQLVQWISRLYGLPMCKYHQAIVLVQSRGAWASIDHYLDCKKLDRKLEAREGAWPTSRLALGAALGADVLSCMRPGRLGESAELAAKLFGLFARRLDNASLPSCLLPVNAGTTCDRNNFDASIGRRCEKWSYSQLGDHVHPETISQMTMRLVRKRTLDVVS